MAREAAGEWNTHSVQITLDGTERTYNRVKAYVGSQRGESPYHRVLQNIGWLLDEGVRVCVRLNVGSHNLEDLCDLVGELADLYAGRDGFCAYAYPIKDSNGRSYIAMDDSAMTEDYFKLLDLLDEAGIGISDSLGDAYRISHCMADHRDCVTVLPDGSFGRCEHYSEGEDMVGSVFAEGLDQEMLRRWAEVVCIPECAECVLYPRCRRLALCPWVNGSCISTDRDFELRVLHRRMIKAYNAYSRRSKASS